MFIVLRDVACVSCMLVVYFVLSYVLCLMLLLCGVACFDHLKYVLMVSISVFVNNLANADVKDGTSILN